MDEEGLHLSGRPRDDMIIRGGENISPKRLKMFFILIRRFEEAAVIGVPDPSWGQEPRAVVV